MYTRMCPKCNKELTYKNIISYTRAVNENWLCRSCAQNETKKITTNLKKLLDDEYESFYWIGFILADGYIANKKRLSITISEKDAEHLQKFCDYVNVQHIEHLTNNTHHYVRMSAQDSIYVPKIAEKFDISNAKTYNPPRLELLKRFTREQILSLAIGFIDGDGSIKHQYKRKDCSLTIKNHSSWLDILNLFSYHIIGKNTAKIDSKGYSKIVISNTKSLINLKKFAIENNLPIMERKWNKIDIDYATFYDIANNRLEKIKAMAANGLTINEIVKKIDIGYGGVYATIKRHNIQVKLEKVYKQKHGIDGEISEREDS